MRTCEVIEHGKPCETKHYAKGMCTKHYARNRLRGNPLDHGNQVFEKREHEKWCSGCKAWLSKSNFSASRTFGSDGLQHRCKSCNRGDKLRVKYNITQDQFLVMLVEQGGVCAMCGTLEPGGHGTWNVDHDHACCPESGRSCGKCIRGLLCMECNKYLGHYENEDMAAKAAVYLERNDKNVRIH